MTADVTGSKRKLIQVPVAELTIGMHIVKLDRPWIETPFLYQGFTLQSERDIQEVQHVCEFVYIEANTEVFLEKKRVKTRAGKTVTTQKRRSRTTYVNKVTIEDELPVAQAAYKHARNHALTMLQAIRLGDAIDVEKTKAVVAECVNSVLRNQGAMMCMLQLKDKDAYTAEHCLRVALLSIAAGRELGLLEGELHDIGLCGMLHDVGKVKVPDAVLNKPGGLTAEELTHMRNHTVYGRQILLSAAGVPPIAVDVAFSHHERVDGRGYPRGVSAEKIPYYAKIVAIADAYDAITSQRVYKEGLTGLEALRIIYDDRGKHFDEELVPVFVRMVGVYPPGHIAEMSNGEVGVILSSDNEYRLKPKVLLVLDRGKQKRRERVINLKLGVADELGRPYRVKRIHRNGAFGIDVQTYIERGLRVS